MNPLHNAPYDPKDVTMTFHKYSDDEIDEYGSLVGCERKENESNDAYRDRIELAYRKAMCIAPIDDMHEMLDELMLPVSFSQHQLDKFIEWLDENKVAWQSRKTALREFADQTPLWKEYVEDAQSE
jgi:hypothetical protein